MRKLRFGEILRIGVDADAVALAAWRRWPRAGYEPLAERALGLAPSGAAGWTQAVLAALEGLLDEGSVGGQPVEIVVADARARLWAVEPPAQAQRLEDLQAACELRYRSLYGGSPSDWLIQADHHVRHTYLAAALPRGLVESLHGLCRERKLGMRAVLPQFVGTWNALRHRLGQSGWLVQAHGRHLTLGVGEKGRLRAVRSSLRPDAAPAGWLADQLQLEALRLDCARPARVVVAGGDRGLDAAGQGANGTDDMFEILPAMPDLSPAMRLACTGWTV